MLSALLGLLASTGLRIGEAVRLKMDDVRLEAQPVHLRILQTKFQKSRLVVGAHQATHDRAGPPCPPNEP